MKTPYMSKNWHVTNTIFYIEKNNFIKIWYLKTKNVKNVIKYFIGKIISKRIIAKPILSQNIVGKTRDFAVGNVVENSTRKIIERNTLKNTKSHKKSLNKEILIILNKDIIRLGLIKSYGKNIKKKLDSFIKIINKEFYEKLQKSLNLKKKELQISMEKSVQFVASIKFWISTILMKIEKKIYSGISHYQNILFYAPITIQCITED